jgi:hypothetical protein
VLRINAVGLVTNRIVSQEVADSLERHTMTMHRLAMPALQTLASCDWQLYIMQCSARLITSIFSTTHHDLKKIRQINFGIFHEPIWMSMLSLKL